MYEFFIFDLLHRIQGTLRLQRITVIFSSSQQINDALVMERLRDHFRYSILPDRIVIVGTESNREQIQGIIKSPFLQETLPSITRYVDAPTVDALWITRNGTYNTTQGKDTEFTSERFIAQLVHEGLMRIFVDRQGILDSKGRYHYVKPSGKHADKFIRTANVLMRGAEVSFIAFSLLPYLIRRPNVTHIYTDTAAINALAYALVSVREGFSDGFRPPTIDSFSSYGGLDKFKFEALEESLLLISASTSHELELKLVRDHKIPQNHIITIYYLGNPLKGSQILCDLTYDKERNPSGFEPIVSYPTDECALCTQGLLAVKIAGDQFLPENPKLLPETLEKKDAPRWLSKFMEAFVGRRVITCHYPRRGQSPGEEHELNIDLRGALSYEPQEGQEVTLPKSEFSRYLGHLITQITPASLKRIIYLDDPASQMLAELISADFKSFNANGNVSLVSAGEVNRNVEKHILDDGTTLVVASVIVSGRTLLATSQSLRKIQTNRSIQYLIGVARTKNEQRLEEVKKNLQYGEFGPRDYKCDIVRSIFLPDEEISPWAHERAFLLHLREVFGTESSFLPMIDKRIELLDAAPTQGGLSANLFWGKPADGSQMRLRPNFAFWEFDYSSRNITQAEVYFTIAAVLHKFRETQRRGGPEVPQFEHHRTILSPRNFDRFNDGIIQASLLRAAHRWEIDYSIDKELSADMKRILEAAFNNIDNEGGEASVEFMLALAQEKLRLTKEDEAGLIAQLKNAPVKFPVIEMFIEFFAKKAASSASATGAPMPRKPRKRKDPPKRE